MKKAVFFYASSDEIGLTSHFATSTGDLYKITGDSVDFYLVSDEKEQNPGLWDEVEKLIPPDRIIKFHDSDYNVLNTRLINIIEHYERVIFHFQGIKHILNTRILLKNYKNKVAALVTIHSFQNGNWKKNLVSFIYSRIILKYITKAIFLSPFAWKNFNGSKRLFKRGKIIHIPFNLPNFEVQYTNDDDKILNKNDFNIVYLANFTKNKGHEKYFEGIVRFVKEYPDVNVYLFGEGKRKKCVLKKIKKAGIENNMFCPGRVERKFVPSILKKTSIALNLSGSENAGHALIEPMLQGVSVIATRVGPGEYLIQDGINGIGISNNVDLYLALKLLKTNSELRKELGINAKTIVNELYDYKKMIKAYKNLYTEL
jgi:glycosyltransferase involved in cell wall biosynthesis